MSDDHADHPGFGEGGVVGVGPSGLLLRVDWPRVGAVEGLESASPGLRPALHLEGADAFEDHRRERRQRDEFPLVVVSRLVLAGQPVEPPTVAGPLGAVQNDPAGAQSMLESIPAGTGFPPGGSGPGAF